MQTISHSDFVVGIFRKELKNRFLCEVNIDGEDVVCYVPSSCHLSNFLKLDGKKVLLVPTATPKSRTKYALFAVPYKRSYIILNTSMANRIIEANISSRKFSFLGKRKIVEKERVINNYKSDLYLPETKTIIEVKSVISLKREAPFPTVYSERTVQQLKQLYNLLESGYRACFVITSLHPYIDRVVIDTSSEFYKELKRCQEKGLIVAAYTSKLEKEHLQLGKCIEIKYETLQRH